MGNEWTLAAELQKLARRDSLVESLRHLGVIAETSPCPVISEDSEWVRGGTETYIYRFWLHENAAEPLNQGFIIKACVAFSFGSELEEILLSWVERRKLLAAFGISTPKLYAFGEGVILEELIPYPLEELARSSRRIEQSLLIQLAQLAAAYSHYGFKPIRGFSDLRSRGQDVVVVDFGEDIGPPSMKNSSSQEILAQLFEQLSTWGVELSTEIQTETSRAFHAFLQATQLDIKEGS